MRGALAVVERQLSRADGALPATSHPGSWEIGVTT
jgi:hypothetical protein